MSPSLRSTSISPSPATFAETRLARHRPGIATRSRLAPAAAVLVKMRCFVAVFGAVCLVVLPGSASAWESSRSRSKLYVEERNHLRVDFASLSDFNAEPTGQAFALGLGTRIHFSESRGRDNLGLVVQVPAVARVDFGRFDIGNVLLALEHRPEALLEGNLSIYTDRSGVRYGVMLPTLSTSFDDARKQQRNLALAMGGFAMLDAGHFFPGVVGGTFDFFSSSLGTDSGGSLLTEVRIGGALLFPIEEASRFALPVHFAFRVGLGAPDFLWCFGTTMSARIGGDLDAFGAAIAGSTGVLMQLGNSRIDWMFDIGGTFGDGDMPSLLTTMRLGWTLAL